ncbi:CGNR zinc finger domain-containing protein [Streptomyces sp. NPDC002144]|uniref:CGNR zinc finger domain-containing protein n=1 Tax=Streptomyces sp. NPDC006668 TaxID=3156903 RepID=UPI00340E2401
MRYIRPVSPPRDDWSGRHSVQAVARRAAALVSALTREHPDPEEVVAVLREYGEQGPLDLTPEDLAGMRAAAVLLREVFTADGLDAAVAALNGLLQEHAGPLRLTAHGGATPWHPHLDRDDDGPWGEWLLASSALALTVLVWDTQRPPGRLCAAHNCRQVFITQGAGPERRYCSRRCATRERVAAHRRRAAAPE